MSVVDYDPSWPSAYESEVVKIRVVLGDEIVRAHHIGSTAVPGLAAKPVIDVLLEVRDLERLDGLDEAMRAIGYDPRGEFGIPGRRYYPKGGDERTCHVHAFAVGDARIAEHLAFRDYLRARPDVAGDYARVKREAARRHRSHAEGYQAYKRDFVTRTLADALAWVARIGRCPVAGGYNCPAHPV
jgi:GrpB-like predicted nucleotidyltransferase (UPF0157 family)